MRLFPVSAEKIHNQVRGLSPSPAAFTTLQGRLLKLFRTVVIESNDQNAPGTIDGIEDGVIRVFTGLGQLGLLELQLEGRKRITAGEFLRGKMIEPGTILGF